MPAPAPAPAPTPAPTPGRSIDLSGTVSSLIGVCPVIAFRVDDRTVYALPDTDFGKGECGDLRNGSDVDIKGVLMSDGRVRADKVTVKGDRGGGKRIE